MIRLILGKNRPGDNENNNWYTRAAATLEAWQREGVLIQDAEPAFYDYEINYLESPNLSSSRQGFICLVRLEDFSRGLVRPHERTYEGIKTERLKLMSSCKANLSQVFTLYPDPTQIVSQYLHEGRDERPVLRFTDDNGVHHRMWRVTKDEAIRRIVECMKDKPLFIADGHHRYETALNYQKHMQERYPERGGRASFNYVLMYLANMHQPGLSILPTHRLISSKEPFDLDGFFTALKKYFTFDVFHFNDAGGEKGAREHFFEALDKKSPHRYTFGLYISGEKRYIRFISKAEAQIRDLLRGYSGVLQELDVTLLDGFILKELLKVEGEDVGLSKGSRNETLEAVHSGEYKAAFLLNPPSIKQVKQVVEAGEVMPRKTTFFYLSWKRPPPVPFGGPQHTPLSR